MENSLEGDPIRPADAGLIASSVTGLLAERINHVLPQTQCTRCGYPDCTAYADAIAVQLAPINRCPPGGEIGIERLSELTGQPVAALDRDCGVEGPRALAVIDENWCIGCTLCVDACPTDAIVGANKRMHTVIPEHCTGCELCLPVCPVDCIALENASGNAVGWAAWSPSQAAHAESRYTARTLRRASTDQVATQASSPISSDRSKGAVIAEALSRAKARLKP